MNYDGRNPADGHGFQMHVGPMKGTSTGHVRIRSSDPRDLPSIVFNYLTTESDRQDMRDAVRVSREIAAQRPFDPYRGEEIGPGPGVADRDADIDAWARRHAESAYHPSCTCAMGAADDPRAVTDGEGRVHGVEGVAGRGCVHHAEDRQRQSQRAHDHDCGEDRRCDPGAGSTRAVGCPVLGGGRHAGKAGLSRKEPRSLRRPVNVSHAEPALRPVPAGCPTPVAYISIAHRRLPGIGLHRRLHSWPGHPTDDHRRSRTTRPTRRRTATGRPSWI